MPATAFNLSGLWKALGFKQAEGPPTVEAVTPILNVGDGSSLVPMPRGPMGSFGCNSGPTGASVNGNTLRIKVIAKGGAYVFPFITSGDNTTAQIATIGSSLSIENANAFPLVAPLRTIPATVFSTPDAEPFTSTCEQGDNPILLPNELATSVPIYGFRSPNHYGFPWGIYTPSGNVFQVHSNVTTLITAIFVQEIPEAFPAR